MEFEQKKQKILNALIEQKCLQDIVDTAAEVLGNPVFVLDMGINTIASSNTIDVSDPVFTQMKGSNSLNPEQIQEVIRKGELERVYSRDEPQQSTFSFTPHRFLAARIRDRFNVIGHACMLECCKPFEEEDGKLLQIMCRAIVFNMLYDAPAEMLAAKYFSLFTDLLDGLVTDDMEIEERRKILGLTLAGPYRLGLIQPRGSSIQASQYYLRETLMRQLPDSLGIVRNNEILFLLCGKSNLDDTLAILRERMFGSNTEVGISRPFSDLKKLRLYYEQASQAVRLAEHSGETERIYLYDQVFVRHMLSCAAKVCDPACFYDPDLIELMGYDQANNTHFTEDLLAYLESGRNVSVAAQKLYIHKNSMYYRISRIEEILGINLHDEDKCFSLQMSLRLYRE